MKTLCNFKRCRAESEFECCQFKFLQNALKSFWINELVCQKKIEHVLKIDRLEKANTLNH